tara:strand:- start:224 stop:544 length:321 start_codon:yes stop_codon:yes gene_type:complete
MINRFLLLPLILVGCTAPVTDPPAHACSLPLDGTPANCPETFGDIKLPRTEVRGEVDIYDPNHWGALHGVYVDSIRKSRIEQTATKPSDSIDQALLEFEMSTESDQ